MALPPHLFERLSTPPQDVCVDLPAWFHLPLQQQALRSILAPERALQSHEHTMWVEQTVLAYVLGQRAEAQAGAPRLLSPALLAALNKLEGPEDDLPLTAFFAMLCRRMRPFDRSADTRTRHGRLRFYLDVLVVQNIGLRIPPALVPDTIWAALHAPYSAHISQALAHFWRKLFPQLPFKPDDAGACAAFKQEALRAAQQLKLDPRFVPYTGLAPWPSTDVLALPPARPVVKKENINLLLWDLLSNAMAPLAAPLEAVLKASGLSYAVHRLPNKETAGAYEGGTNIIAIHPDCLADGMLAHGLQNVQGRKNILYAFWETGRLSDAVRMALPLVDEIWVPNKEQQGLFAGACAAPVYVAPLPVQLAPPAPHLTRPLCGLKDDAFVFLCVVDGADSFARKNILGAVEAFQHAFQKNENVQLLIKSRNFNRNLAGREEGAWKRLARRMEGDARIMHLHEDYAPSELAALYGLANCFVSLHRASPFSASTLEAACAGLPVITSATGRVHEVLGQGDAHFIPVKKASVVFDVAPVLDKELGHFWYDPDVAEAAKAMQRVAAVGDTVKKPNENLAQKLSAAACGVALRKRLMP